MRTLICLFFQSIVLKPTAKLAKHARLQDWIDKITELQSNASISDSGRGDSGENVGVQKGQ